MLNDCYKAAIVGTHACGKTTMLNSLNSVVKTYGEAPINHFMGKNCYLGEALLYVDYIKINKRLSSEVVPYISDRLGILSVLIYTVGFNRMGWMSDGDASKVFNFVNTDGVDWVLPKKILYINESIPVLKSRIIKRGRKGLNEEDSLYLGTVNELYKDYFSGFDVFPELSSDLKKSFKSVPVVRVKSTDSLESIINIIK